MSLIKAGNTPTFPNQNKSMEINPWYITGFVDGEGCFHISFSKRNKLKTKIEVRPGFSISQHRRSKSIIEQIKVYFGCGGIRLNKFDQTY